MEVSQSEPPRRCTLRTRTQCPQSDRTCVGPISGELARVVLPDTMPDTLSEEMRPPAKQKLTEEKRRIKEEEMFENICNYFFF